MAVAAHLQPPLAVVLVAEQVVVPAAVPEAEQVVAPEAVPEAERVVQPALW
ncbi:hypothetical protein [Pseudomonas protegens]|uniref:hypothetical protein n=1 Tax=Pseudomonas protegens TaxID=380021 RepID=UPI00383B658F